MPRKVVCVTGGRQWGDMEITIPPTRAVTHNPLWREQRHLVNSALCLAALWWPELELIHGDCPQGADQCAERWYVQIGKFLDVVRTPYPADWKRFGRGAGPMRNQTMADRMPDLVLVFPGSAGTADMKRRAMYAQLNVIEVGHGPVEQWREGLSELLVLGQPSRRAR